MSGFSIFFERKSLRKISMGTMVNIMMPMVKMLVALSLVYLPAFT